MRVTDSSTYRTLMQSMNRNSGRLQAAQIAAATGKKLQKASDNPAGVGPVLVARGQLQTAGLFLKNSAAAQDRLKAQDTELAQADNLLVRAIELTIAAGNGSYGRSEREAMANEIRDIKVEMLGGANGQMNGRYFYGGFQDRTPPFSVNPDYDPVLDPRPVLYNGDNGAVQLEIAPDEKMTVNFTGNAVFLGDEDGDGLVDAGRVDLFAVLTSLEEAMRANDQAGVTALVDDLYAAQEQIGVYQGKTGSALGRLDRSIEQMREIQVDLEEIISRYQDVDLVEAITDMTRQEQALQAAMGVTGRIAKLSILDYL